MVKAVLFDLDDTLLGNSMDTFLPAYFGALTRWLEHLVPPERLIGELGRATQAMNAPRHTELTNEEAFASVFYRALDADRSRLESAIERFYAEEFPKLRKLTRKRPEARSLVGWALEEGLQVAVATNPLFPRVAVEERLAWAGVPADEIDYALVTTYENMHATKAHHAYYYEILTRLGRRADECLMVGDSWEMDVVPASSVGIHVYWVSGSVKLTSAEVRLAGCGSLRDLWHVVETQGSFPI